MSRSAYIAIVVVGLAVAAQIASLAAGVGFDEILQWGLKLRSLTGQYPVLGPVLFALSYFLVSALALPFAAAFSLLGGYLFGLVWGTVLVLGAATAGSLVVFLVARGGLGRPLRRRAYPLYETISKDVSQNAFYYLLFLRLVPLFPFFMVNIVGALFDIRSATFVAATLLGMFPGALVYVNLGTEIGNISQPSDLLSSRALLALSLLGALALLPVLVRRWIGIKAA